MYMQLDQQNRKFTLLMNDLKNEYDIKLYHCNTSNCDLDRILTRTF